MREREREGDSIDTFVMLNIFGARWYGMERTRLHL